MVDLPILSNNSVRESSLRVGEVIQSLQLGILAEHQLIMNSECEN